MTSSASGKMEITNADFDNQSQSGLVLTGDSGLVFSGTINASGSSGIHVISSSDTDWSFNGLTISNSATGVQHDGDGEVRLVDSTMETNVNDIVIDDGSVTFVEGDIGTGSGVMVNGGGVFTRARFYDVTLESGSSAVSGALLKLIDANGRAVDEGKSDATGLVDDLEFNTYTIDASGQNTMNLAGMKVASVYKSGTGQSTEFPYAYETVSLSDTSGNSDTIDMTKKIDYHVCYRYNGNYGLAQCTGVSYSGTNTLTSGLVQYDAYYAMGGEFDNKAILMDNSYNYMDAATQTWFNNSIIFTTGFNRIITLF